MWLSTDNSKIHISILNPSSEVKTHIYSWINNGISDITYTNHTPSFSQACFSHRFPSLSSILYISQAKNLVIINFLIFHIQSIRKSVFAIPSKYPELNYFPHFFHWLFFNLAVTLFCLSYFSIIRTAVPLLIIVPYSIFWTQQPEQCF